MSFTVLMDLRSALIAGLRVINSPLYMLLRALRFATSDSTSLFSLSYFSRSLLSLYLVVLSSSSLGIYGIVIFSF
jgi:hypothetical protein